MSNVILSHTFNGIKLTSLTDDAGEFWFIAKEVAELLDYDDAEKLTRRLDSDEFKIVRSDKHGSQTGGRGVLLISESGLYGAIFGSQKAEAKVFKKWVRSVLLPTLRKTGRYDMADYKKLQTENTQLQKQVKYFKKVCSAGSPSKKEILEGHRNAVQREIYRNFGGFFDSEVVCSDQLHARMMSLDNPDYFDGSLLPKILMSLGFVAVKKPVQGYEVWTKPGYPKTMLDKRISEAQVVGR